jgi:hypothetical protein
MLACGCWAVRLDTGIRSTHLRIGRVNCMEGLNHVSETVLEQLLDGHDLVIITFNGLVELLVGLGGGVGDGTCKLDEVGGGLVQLPLVDLGPWGWGASWLEVDIVLEI